MIAGAHQYDSWRVSSVGALEGRCSRCSSSNLLEILSAQGCSNNFYDSTIAVIGANCMD